MDLRTVCAAIAVVGLTATASAKSLTLPAETNLRAAPGTKSEVITLIPKGSEVDVGECDAGWCKVTFGDKEGFAISRNLGEAPPARTATAPRAQPQADMQRLRRGYEQYFDGNGQNDQAADLQSTPRQYSQNRIQPRQEEFYDDEDDMPVVYGRPAYVPGPPVYYSYGPYPRVYYGWGPGRYYRRW
jgi:uncharacterized protein YgiM (DUF1202 family)